MLISTFTAKVDVSQTTVTLIFRKLKNDERDHDRERKFVPKRLGTGMDAKTVEKSKKIGRTTSAFYFSRTYVRWSTLPTDYHQLST